MTRVPPRRFNSLEEFGISTISPTKSFVINHDCVIYQKYLGPITAKTAQLMEAYNPGPHMDDRSGKPGAKRWKKNLPANDAN